MAKSKRASYRIIVTEETVYCGRKRVGVVWDENGAAGRGSWFWCASWSDFEQGHARTRLAARRALIRAWEKRNG